MYRLKCLTATKFWLLFTYNTGFICDLSLHYTNAIRFCYEGL